jgi:HEAT repeat protein
MKISRIRMRWTIGTLMVVVALCALGLHARRVMIERAPVYRLIRQLQTGNNQARLQAARDIGRIGPKAAFAEGALTGALKDPDPGVCKDALYALIKIGSKSTSLLHALVAEIATPPTRPTSMIVGFSREDPVSALKTVRPPASVIVPLLKNALNRSDLMVSRRVYPALREVASWSDPSSPELAAALLEGLADPSFDIRLSAAQGLARLDHTAREEAVARLTDDFRNLRSPRSCEAVLLLREFVFDAQTALAALLDRIRYGDETSRLIGLFLLSQFGEMATPTVPTLIQVMTERDTDRKVLFHLGSLWWRPDNQGGRPSQVQRLIDDPKTPNQTSVTAMCVRVLGVIGAAAEQQAIHHLIEVLQGTDEDRTRSAIVALGEFGPKSTEAIPALVEVARSRSKSKSSEPSPSDRESGTVSLAAIAATSLGQIGAEGKPEMVAILASLLEADDAGARNDAAIALWNLGPKAQSAVPALLKAMKSPDVVVRRWSVKALAKIGGPEVRAASPALWEARNDEDEIVRTDAIAAFSDFGDEATLQSFPSILRVLWDFGPELGVVESLGQIGPAAAPAVPVLLIHNVRRSRRAEFEAALDRILPRSESQTVAGAIAALRASEPSARFKAAYELGRLIEKQPVPAEGVAALGESLKDPDPLVRRMAAAGLGHLGSGAETAMLALIRATRDPDDAVRKLSASALGQVAPKSEMAIAALAELMNDRSSAVRLWTAEVLGSLGSAAAPAMIAALPTQDVPTRTSLVTHLGQLRAKDDAIVSSLVKAIDDPAPEVRAWAVQGLRGLVPSRQDVVVPALLKAMGDSDSSSWHWASLTLGTIRPHQLVLSALIERLRQGEPRARRAAAFAMAQMGGDTTSEPELTSQALPPLAAALTDPDPTVRSAAAWAIQRFGAAAKPVEAALRAAINDPNRHVRDSVSAALRAIAENPRGF